MMLSAHEVGLDSLDTLESVDALCLFVAEDERPLRGTAGYVDWRLCGALSRVLKGGFFTGAPDDWLLLPSNGRIRMRRIFAAGIGRSDALDPQGLGSALEKAARTLSRANVESVALEIPGGAALDDGTRAALLVNQFLPKFAGARVAVLSERALARLLPLSGGPGRGVG